MYIWDKMGREVRAYFLRFRPRPCLGSVNVPQEEPTKSTPNGSACWAWCLYEGQRKVNLPVWLGRIRSMSAQLTGPSHQPTLERVCLLPLPAASNAMRRLLTLALLLLVATLANPTTAGEDKLGTLVLNRVADSSNRSKMRCRWRAVGARSRTRPGWWELVWSLWSVSSMPRPPFLSIA